MSLTDTNGDRILDSSGDVIFSAGPQPSTPTLILKWQGEIDGDTIIRHAGTRAVITRLVEAGDTRGRETLLGPARYHQGVCIQLGDNDATRESTSLWYPLMEINSQFGVVPAWAVLVVPGSRWYVEIWG